MSEENFTKAVAQGEKQRKNSIVFQSFTYFSFCNIEVDCRNMYLGCVYLNIFKLFHYNHCSKWNLWQSVGHIINCYFVWPWQKENMATQAEPDGRAAGKLALMYILPHQFSPLLHCDCSACTYPLHLWLKSRMGSLSHFTSFQCKYDKYEQMLLKYAVELLHILFSETLCGFSLLTL